MYSNLIGAQARRERLGEGTGEGMSLISVRVRRVAARSNLRWKLKERRGDGMSVTQCQFRESGSGSLAEMCKNLASNVVWSLAFFTPINGDDFKIPS